jgi:hypothetical protein
MSNWATLASGARAGTKIVAGIPAAAAKPAKEDAALPVEAQVIRDAFFSNAFTTPIALARSLNDAVGLRPSSLTQQRATPNSTATLGASYSGVQPTCRWGISVAIRHRQQGKIAPHGSIGVSGKRRRIKFLPHRVIVVEHVQNAVVIAARRAEIIHFPRVVFASAMNASKPGKIRHLTPNPKNP